MKKTLLLSMAFLIFSGVAQAGPKSASCAKVLGEELKAWGDTLRSSAEQHKLIFGKDNKITIPASGKVQTEQCITVDDKTFTKLQFQQLSTQAPIQTEIMKLCGSEGGPGYTITIENGQCVRKSATGTNVTGGKMPHDAPPEDSGKASETGGGGASGGK